MSAVKGGVFCQRRAFKASGDASRPMFCLLVLSGFPKDAESLTLVVGLFALPFSSVSFHPVCFEAALLSAYIYM